MGMHFEDITGGKVKLGGVTYNMTEAKINGQVIWPSTVTVTYEVTVAYIVFYRNGQEIYNVYEISADGSVYAKVFGNVAVYENGTRVRTLSWVQLDVRLGGGTSMYVTNREIHGPDWATTVASAQTAIVWASYSTSPEVSAGTIDQEANVKTATGDPVYGTKQYGTPSTTTSNYTLILSASSYSSSSNRCPASGGTTTLTRTATHQEDTVTPWTRTVTQYYTYTARPGQQYGESLPNQSGSDTTSTTVTDTPTVSRVSGSLAFTISGLTVTIPSEGTQVFSSGRSATFEATNGSVTRQVTIWQDVNVITSTRAGAITSVTSGGASSPMSVAYTGATYTLTVNGYRYAVFSSQEEGRVTDVAWVLSSNQTWATVNQSTLQVTLTSNFQSGSRIAVITVTDPDYPSVSSSFSFVQSAAALTIVPDTLVLSSADQYSGTLEIYTSSSWRLSTSSVPSGLEPGEDPPHDTDITFSTYSGTGNAILPFTVGQNNGASERQLWAKVSLVGASPAVERTLTITQPSAVSSLKIYPNVQELVFTASQPTATLTVESPTAWSADAGIATWLQFSPASGVAGSTTVQFSATIHPTMTALANWTVQNSSGESITVLCRTIPSSTPE